MHHRTVGNVCCLLVAALMWLLSLQASPAWEAADLAEQLSRLVTGPRHAGSPGNLEMERRVIERFSGSGHASGEIIFAAPSLEPGKARLLLGDMEMRILPMHPTVVRPGNFSEPVLTTRLVELGRGTLADIDAAAGAKLEGALAVMDFASGDAWKRLTRFGFSGFIFIGGEDESWEDAAGKVHNGEGATPRYFVDSEAGQRLRQHLSAAAAGAVTVTVESEPTRWVRRELRNPWCFIPGTDPDMSKKVIVLTAPLDSNSVVPDLAYGAQYAANLQFLLETYDRLRERPAGHSVLLVAVNAHCQGFRGERELGWYLLSPLGPVERLRGEMARRIRWEEMMLGHYQRLAGLSQGKELEELLVDFRTLVDDSIGRRVTVKEPIVALARRDMNQMKAEQLRLRRREDLPVDEQERLLAELEARKTAYVNVLTLFNRVRPRKVLSDLSEAEVEILRGYVHTLTAQYQGWVEANRRQLRQDEENSSIRQALEGRAVAMVINLALTWGDDFIGFAAEREQGWERRFGSNSVRIARQAEADLGMPPASVFLDTMTSLGGRSEYYYFGIDPSGLYGYHSANKTPAFSLMTAFAPRGRGFSTSDTIENLDMERVARHYRFMHRFFELLMDDGAVTVTDEMPAAKSEWSSWSSIIRTYKFDEFSASVLPQLPVADSLVVLSHWVYANYGFSPLIRGDVLNFVMLQADERATVFARNLTEQNYTVDAYQFDSDFLSPRHVIDVGDIHDRYNSNLQMHQDKTLALFPCKEFPLANRYDASLVGNQPIVVNGYIPLEARQNSTPMSYGLAGVRGPSSKWMQRSDGPAAIFAEPDDELKLLTQHNRPMLNATATMPEGKGYMQPPVGDYFWLATQDLGVLNEHRLNQMHGVTNELAVEALALGEEKLAEAEAAREQLNPMAWSRLAHVALGSMTKAYAHLRSMNNDMLIAVVFYVALLLPFCFFMQKLCFSFVKIERQMAAFALLFVITFLIFRYIHPAFRVAQAAEAIFVAFVMLALGLFVIFVLHKRFEGEMQALFQTYLGVTATVGYSTVGQKAMLIGVNNMKRRRLRTFLTTATIVLITFAMLAFSSVSRKMSPTMIARSAQAPYTGLFYQWPGSLTMDEPTLLTMQELFSDSASDMIVRRWLIGKRSTFGGPIAIRGSGSEGRSVQVDAILGLPQADQYLLSREGYPLLEGGSFFSSDSAREVLLPLRVARALEIVDAEPGSVSVRIMGQDFRVIGFLEGDRLRAMRDMNQLPILPIKEVTASGWQVSETESNLNIDMAESNESSIFFVDPAALCVMPEQTAASLGAAPFSLSVVFEEGVDVWAMMDRMLRATEAKFFIGSRRGFEAAGGRQMGAGVYFIGSGYKTSIGGLTRLLIPLLIAGTIILNTMLGSVYERKYEIAVYNAIGLNPSHIRMFFLAEAFVYSVIGSVGGYLIGQLLAMGLIHFKLVEGLNLNFSSLIVVYVILFTIAVVLLSTLYPAHAATRMAVPSGKRKWSLPEHDGTHMNVVFPFIYQPDLAVGVLQYVEQYFSRFTEASVGELIANLLERRRYRDDGGRDAYSMEYDLALAPYDLGVTQSIVFHLAYDEVVQSYRLRMEIERKSGQDTNWVTVNRPFLEKMRKYLIQWRNMGPPQHRVYVEQAMRAFDGEAASPGRGGS